MDGSMWLMLLYVFVAGAVGGLVNALTTNHGFPLPKFKTSDDGVSVWMPGSIGVALTGAVAAVVSWGLYGPLSAVYIVGTSAALSANVGSDKIGLSLASLTGAILVGVGGGRWLTNEVDKKLLKATASKAAGSAGSNTESQKIALASPLEAFNIAQAMPKS